MKGWTKKETDRESELCRKEIVDHCQRDEHREEVRETFFPRSFFLHFNPSSLSNFSAHNAHSWILERKREREREIKKDGSTEPGDRTRTDTKERLLDGCLSVSVLLFFFLVGCCCCCPPGLDDALHVMMMHPNCCSSSLLSFTCFLFLVMVVILSWILLSSLLLHQSLYIFRILVFSCQIFEFLVYCTLHSALPSFLPASFLMCSKEQPSQKMLRIV